MPNTQVKYRAPISPFNLSPTPGLDLSEIGTNFFWELGSLEVSSFTFTLSNNIDGHIIGHTPIPNEQTIVSAPFSGNTFSPPIVPQGYPLLYATLGFTSAGVTRFLQEIYSTDNLQFISPKEGDLVPSLAGVIVEWSSAGSNQNYTFSILDITGTTTLYTVNTVVINTVIPLEIIQSLSDGSSYIFRVDYVSLSETIQITILTNSQIDNLFIHRYNQQVVDSYKYPGYINLFRDGKSNRYAANPSFKRRITSTVPLVKSEAAGFLLKIREKGEDFVLVPIWHYEVLVASVSGNVYKIKESEELAHVPIVVGARVIAYRDTSNFILSNIVSISGDDITLSQSINAVSIIPIEIAQIRYNQGNIQDSSFMTLALDMSILQVKPDYELSQNWVGNLPSWATSEVINYPVNNYSITLSDIKDPLSTKVIDDYVITTERPLITLSYSIALSSRKEIGEAFHFITQMRGTQEERIHPLFGFPLDIKLAALSSIKLHNNGIVSEISQETIRFFMYGNDYRTVTNIITTATDVEFIFDTAFSSVPANCDIQPAFLARLSSETLTINYINQRLAEMPITITEIPHE